MTLVIDRHIPFLIEAVRAGWSQVAVRPMEPEAIDAAAVHDADALVVRTRTQVNKELLEGSAVQLVCSATIGYDHIDTAYCDAHAIRWATAPGCNAQAVCDYIAEALDEYHTLRSQSDNYHAPTIGVVGVGHVGSLVARMAEQKGMRVLLNDPPRGIGVSLEQIACECDIITFHVPLTFHSPFPTFHLCDAAFLAQTQPHALIINAARGGVVDEQALLASGRPFILDTWENEPQIHPVVAEQALLASMHIAGYSLQGKRNAAQMCLDAIAEHFALPRLECPQTDMPHGDSQPGWLQRISSRLKSHPEQFEMLRKAYPLR